MEESSNQRRARLLGESYGAATSKLRKMLLFDFAKRLNEDICYQCGTRIEFIEDFSIEHTIPWQNSDNPKEIFFDLSKIAYSHSSCNTKAAIRPKKWENTKIRRREYARVMREDPEKYKKHLEDKKRYYHLNKQTRE